MKNSLFFVLIFICFGAKILAQDTESVYKKYLNNGAYKYSYFHPKYQQYIDSALVILPKNPFLWQQKAMPYFKKKKYELGMKFLDNAVKYDDEYEHYLSYRAFIKCVFQKNYQGALDDLDVLIKKYPKGIIMDHTFYFYKGLSEIQLDNYKDAETNLNISIKQSLDNKANPHFLELFYLGITYLEREDYANAMHYFDESLQYNPKFSDCQFYKAKCLYYLDKKSEALELLKKAKENFNAGFSINEDNSFYEDYPYQIKTWNLDGWIDSLSKKY